MTRWVRPFRRHRATISWGAGPVEPSDFDLLADHERREWARNAVLKHDEEGAVLLVLAIRVHERFLDEATQVDRARLRLPSSSPAS